MTLGPNIILKLPTSGTLVKIATIASGNTFGATFWTDGKREAPMLPDQPWLRRHPTTDELFWTDECEKIAEQTFWDQEPTYSNIPFAAKPTVHDYRRALSSGIASTPEQEKYIRMRCWWAANDPVRRGASTAPPLPEFRENLLKLRTLFDLTDAHQRLMAAEASRQLRDFTTAANLLDFQFPKDHAKVVHLIKNLTSEEDFTVRQVA